MHESPRKRQRSAVRFVGPATKKEIVMREHSGAEGKNNNRNPSMRDHEKDKGQSGEAVHDSKTKSNSPSRKSTVRS
jgi:hypothetical protein